MTNRLVFNKDDVTTNDSHRKATLRISAGNIGEIVFMYPRNIAYVSARGYAQTLTHTMTKKKYLTSVLKVYRYCHLRSLTFVNKEMYCACIAFRGVKSPQIIDNYKFFSL